MPPTSSITAVRPPRAVEGGRVSILGSGFRPDPFPIVTVGNQPAQVVFASSTKLVITVPPDVEGGSVPVRVAGVKRDAVFLSVADPWATGLHQVDNPAFDRDGHLFVTYSGPRGQEAPVSLFRVTPAGTREPFASGIVNATSLTFGPDGHLYVSSRFEGAVYRVAPDGTHARVATELGVACGIAFDRDGWMYVGDRSGTVFRVREGEVKPFATLPASIAAFHLAMSPSGELFVSAPTLGSYDHIYRVSREGTVTALAHPFGRPQGLAFADDGTLHVVDALAGSSGLYRLSDSDAAPELVVAGKALVGVAFGPAGTLVVTTNDTAYRFGAA